MKDLFGEPIKKPRKRRVKEIIDTTGWPLVVQFSGGKTSAHMTRRLIDDGREPIVLFENTGRENNETLDFVHECDQRWGLNVKWLEYRHDKTKGYNARGHDLGHGFAVVNYETAARIGEHGPFDIHLQWKLDRETGSLPNPVQRSCTGQLKIKTMVRYVHSIGIEKWVLAVGIRADESHRKIEIITDCPKYIQPIFPLCNEWPTTKEQVNEFWQAQPFNLNLQEHDGNCDMCFMKAVWKIRDIAKRHPEKLAWWEGWEDKFRQADRGDGSTFRKERSFAGIRIGNMVENSLLTEDDEIGCSCMEGSWSALAEDDDGSKQTKLKGVSHG